MVWHEIHYSGNRCAYIRRDRGYDGGGDANEPLSLAAVSTIALTDLSLAASALLRNATISFFLSSLMQNKNTVERDQLL